MGFFDKLDLCTFLTSMFQQKKWLTINAIQRFYFSRYSDVECPYNHCLPQRAQSPQAQHVPGDQPSSC